MLTGYQYFVHFHSKTSHIEKVQNKDRLIQLNLPAPKYRRLRWDMIEVLVRQKIWHYYILPEISVNSSSVTRGNNYKLLDQTFTTAYGGIHLHLGYRRYR